MAFRLLILVSVFVCRLAIADELVVIGHASLGKTDRVTLQRLFTGRVVSIGQQTVIPVNLPAGHPVRDEFLQAIMDQNEERYTGYWLVRRYVGKGSPPMELGSIEEIARHVAATPGAIGYLPLSKVPQGVSVIYKR